MNKPQEYRIVWIPVRSVDRVSFRLRSTTSVEHPAERAFDVTGVPSVEGASTPKEDAIGLLSLAAEVEHALLVQYLYAAASVDPTGGSDSVHARKVIVSVAIQEMGHFVAVQNLLLAIAGRTGYHLGRDRLRAASDRNPLPFVLEPLTHSALSKFVTIERPDLALITDPSLLSRLKELEDEAAQAAGTGPHPVAALYTALYWIFQPTDAPAGPFQIQNPPLKLGWHVSAGDFLPRAEVDDYATKGAEWEGYPGLKAMPVHNSEEALSALYEIMVQGEGSPGTMGPSHFASFLTVLDSFEAKRVRVVNMPRTPRVDDQPPSEDRLFTTIKDEYTILWGRLFNLRYSHLILCVGHALSLGVDDKDRAQLIGFALTVMHGLNNLTRQMLRLKVSKDQSPAGPTWGLLDDTLPSTDSEFWIRHRAMTADQQRVIAAVTSRLEYAGDDMGKIIVQQLVTDDQPLMDLLNAH